MSSKPLVLLSNDDGYAAPGLVALRDALRSFADVVTVAPETEQSATSHALSLHRPMRLRAVSEAVFALDGTPADCIYVALFSGDRILPRRPSLVVSGINHGMNLGADAFYSGTIAAAREGALRGFPALAASAFQALPLVDVAASVARLARGILAQPGADRVLLSANYPKGWNGTLRATRLGSRIYDDGVEFRNDPRGKEYLWLGQPGFRHESEPGTDTEAYDEGVGSVTPLCLDLWNPAGEGITKGVLAAHDKQVAQ